VSPQRGGRRGSRARGAPTRDPGAGPVAFEIVLQPVGPLPPQVYWRRRLVVAGVVVVVLLLALAVCSGGPAPRGPGAGAALSGSATPTSTGAGTITPSPGTAGGPAQGQGPATSQTSGSGTPSGTAPAGGVPVSNPPAATAPPQPCPDSALTVVASTAKPAYRVGETPVLKLAVRNTGTVACVRDVGPRQQEMLLYAGSTRIWSSNDCYPDGGTDIRTLSPGESISSTVVWSGLSSQPGCAGTRTRVKAGSYDLFALVGGARSRPATLVLQQ
jgi:hypothetical protein